MKYKEFSNKLLPLVLTFFVLILSGCPQPIDTIDENNQNPPTPPTYLETAENPYNIQNTEVANQIIEITWDGNINSGSYAIGITSDDSFPITVDDFDELFFCYSLSFQYNVLSDTHYYFWIIPTNIVDSDENKITPSNLQNSQYISYFKDSTTTGGEDPSENIKITVFVDTNDETHIVKPNDTVCSSSSLSITPDESFDGQLIYNYRVDGNDWSEDYYLFLDSSNFLFNGCYNNYYGLIEVRAKKKDGQYYDVLSFTNKEPEQLQSISFKDESNDEVVYREIPYNQNLTLSALKPTSYDDSGTYYYSINDEEWIEFSDSANNQHVFIPMTNIELEVTSLKIKYKVSDIYETPIYTFKDTNNLDLQYTIDTISPTHSHELIKGEPYSFSIHWERPNDNDLDSVAIFYKSHDDQNYTLYKEYTSDSNIPPRQDEYISTDEESIDVKITYTDKAGNSSHYIEDNITIIKNLTHLCVSPNPTGKGGSWQTASDLQTAIEFAYKNNIPEVWVQKGTYQPKTAINGTANNHGVNLYSFSLRNNVRVIGGFNGDETSVSSDFSFEENQTILMPYYFIYEHSHQIFYHPQGTNLNDSAILERVILKDGLANQPFGHPNLTYITGTHGGAVYNKSSSPTFINCKFKNNDASVAGGAVYQAFSSSKYINCIFESNTVSFNTQTYDTGDLNSSPCNGGGAIYSWNSSLTLINCLFDGNTTGRFGSALYLDAGSSILSINSTFLNNNTYTSSNADLGIIYIYSFSEPQDNNFYNTIFDFDKLIFSKYYDDYNQSSFYSKSNCSSDNNNIINTGDNSYLPVDEYDIDHDNNKTELIPTDIINNNRINNSTVDIGCLEYNN